MTAQAPERSAARRLAGRIATVRAATRPTARTDIDGYPMLGVGLFHAMALAVALWVPLTYAVAAQAASVIAGFPIARAVVLVVLASLAGAIVSVVRPLPGAGEIIGRIVAAGVAALAFRLTVPSVGTAVDVWRAGDVALLSWVFWLTAIVVVVAAVTGQAIATAVSWLATRSPTRLAALQRSRRGLAAWFGAVLVVSVVDAATAGGALGSLLVALGALASFAVLADLRLRTPPPPGAHDAIVATRTSAPWAVAAAVMAAAAGLAVVLLPFVPFGALGSIITPAWLDWLHTEDAGQGFLRAWIGEWSTSDPDTPTGRVTQVDVPLPYAIISLLLLVLVMRILRRHGFPALHRMRRRFRRGRAHGELGEQDLVATTSEDDDRGEPGALRRLFTRVRRRPKDPRAAVLHDYLHVERLLARQDRGRAPSETPHEHAVRVHVSAEHEELADLAADARFAREVPHAEAVARAARLRDLIEQALR